MTTPSKTKKAKAKRKPPVPNHPLLTEAFNKYGKWGAFAKALGYSAPGTVYQWVYEPKTFSEAQQSRVRDLLDGKPLMPLKGSRKANGYDHGELGLAIIVTTKDKIAGALDVAQAMGGKSVFQKQTELGVLVIYKFALQTDLLAFKDWAKTRMEITTP